jgi:transcription elongation factor B subunit 2
MYVRVKRQRTTLFLHVEPTDTVLQVKTKIEDLLQAAPANQRLYKDGALLEDGRSLAELRVETDDELALALRQEGAPGGGLWADLPAAPRRCRPDRAIFCCCCCRRELGGAERGRLQRGSRYQLGGQTQRG